MLSLKMWALGQLELTDIESIWKTLGRVTQIERIPSKLKKSGSIGRAQRQHYIGGYVGNKP